MKVDSRWKVAQCSDADAFGVIERIGGKTGYYYADWLWRARARLDLLFGGPGLRPGRPDPDHVTVGDVIDCWQVSACEPDRLLRLKSRMKMPGDGWLQFEVEDLGGKVLIRQTARFRPRGLTGYLYWYALYPLHLVIWSGMIEAIARNAEARGRDSDEPVAAANYA